MINYMQKRIQFQKLDNYEHRIKSKHLCKLNF